MSYSPWRDAARRYPNIHIEWHPISPVRAAWIRDAEVIVVDDSISRTERRCALAHEIAHMDTGDRPTEMCFFQRRQETSADRIAARRLIDIEDLAAAVRWCSDAREVAEALDVTLSVLALRAATLHPSERGMIEAMLRRCERVA